MQRRLTKLGLILGLGLMSHFAFGGSKWELLSEKDGIKVDRREVPYSPRVRL
jgi:hypothetical protein